MRYFVWFIGLLGMLFAVIFGVILIRNVLRGYRTASPVAANTTTIQTKDLSKTTVELTIDGPVVADENHRSIHYRVNQSSRTATVRTGYQHATLREQNYGNNAAAYDAFVRALDTAGFARADNRRNRNATSCTTGRTYTMTTLEEGKDPIVLTTSSCLTAAGDTFGGNTSSVIRLFQLQIPGHSELVRNIGGVF